MVYDFAGKNILITGGSGFLGVPLVDRLIPLGANIRVVARDEGKLIELKGKHPSVEILSGDISDPFYVKAAMHLADGVFHLAAFKHVGLAETQTRACVMGNTVGSLNILDQSLEQSVDFVLGISTDKAAQVAGVYGASKLLMEKLFSEYERINPLTKYRIVRYGNVLYSTGSVLCKWKALIEAGKDVIVTEPEATRFFWTVDQALDLIFDGLTNAPDSSPWVPEMKSIKIQTLLEAMIHKYSGGQEIGMKIIGLQPGENLHERVLETGPASNEVEHYTFNETLSLI